jgi:endonuclease YncB( thermonuclease family)
MIKRLLRRFGALCLLLILIGLWAYSDVLFPPEVIRAPTARVIDGDSIVAGGTTFRLYGIDAPEYRQMCTDAHGADWPCGHAARSQLEVLVHGGPVTCTELATDQYHRTVARCATAATPDLGEAMVRTGLAISPALRGEAPYAAAEQMALDGKLGIWQGDYQIPAEWRAAHLISQP